MLGGATSLMLGCLVENSGYRPQEDQAAPDQSPPPDQPPPPDQSPPPPDLRPCPTYPPGGGGFLNRPEVLVPGGTFEIGAVRFPVQAFYLDVFEVTVGAYRDCRKAGFCAAEPQTAPSCNWTATAGARENQPMNCLTWAQARDFCAAAGRRLPMESELAYAAAGAPPSRYPWGEAAAAGQLCWRRELDMGSCPVGQFGKTLLGADNCGGVADLAGNLYERTGTEYQIPFVHPEKLCSPASPFCSTRGGSWIDSDESYLRTGYRGQDAPDKASSIIGFRCARSGL